MRRCYVLALRIRRLQVPQKPVERLLIGVVVLPLAEIAQVPLARRIDGTPHAEFRNNMSMVGDPEV
jgi:hypothetical protein